ncbi:MAG: hypothetical protein JKY84_06495 [Emcibacteraceae bacterium]|nr:hypothetical protein [Emcibacteraceae bacterium]
MPLKLDIFVSFSYLPAFIAFSKIRILLSSVDDGLNALAFLSNDKARVSFLKLTAIRALSVNVPLASPAYFTKSTLGQKNTPSLFGSAKDILNQDNLSELYQLPIARMRLEQSEIIVPLYS